MTTVCHLVIFSLISEAKVRQGEPESRLLRRGTAARMRREGLRGTERGPVGYSRAVCCPSSAGDEPRHSVRDQRRPDRRVRKRVFR